MFRRSATVLAATSALVLATTAPALADHGDHEFLLDTSDGNLRYCADLRDGGPQGDYKLPEGSEELLKELFAGDHADWNLDEDKNKRQVGETDDPPLLSHSWWTVSFDDEDDRKNVFLNVDVEDGVQVIVIVKAGPGSNIFLNEPGDDLTGLYAPSNQESGKHPTISHYSICKLGKDGDGEEPNPDKTKTPGPETTETPDPEMTKTPSPDTSKSAAPVPTAVPAGASGSGDASMGPVGVVAAALMVMAGAAALLRRRFANQS